MKNILIFAIGFILAFLLFRSCSNEDDLETSLNNLKEKLKTEQTVRESKELEITALNKAIDSLAVIKDKIKTQVVYRERQIDENIAKNPANAIVEFRQSLTENQELPDNTDYPTYRELGLSAKLMAKVPKLELQINLCEQQNELKDKIILDDSFIKKSYENSLEIKDLEINKYTLALKKEQSFWNSNTLWFGIGAASTVAIIFLTGVAK